MKSSTLRFMDALLAFRCCSRLMPVLPPEAQEVVSKSRAFLKDLIANWFMELTEKTAFRANKQEIPDPVLVAIDIGDISFSAEK